ncbi:dienelactone hydrolase family protein [Chelativorans alearense]|uniref:dienelactone hydrolase family protein n=1 Tax=Chelativorans alearense TaxID=2681495 RepID=UPI0013D5944D|nr:dienelactone hydrolase family protein [Chelativorans alearense]
MTTRWETTTVNGSPMRVYLGIPDRPRRHPGIIVAQHGSGVDAFLQDVVHRLHREGYAVAAPELFHRQPEGLGLTERLVLMRDDDLVADISAAIAVLRGLDPHLGTLGVVGFCMGGRVSYLAACAIPGFKAAAVFYGGNILKAWGDGPTALERSEGLDCPLIGFFGAEDKNPSPEDVNLIHQELARLGKWHEFHSYQDTGHAFLSFGNPDRYRPRAARGAWGELLAFFDDRLWDAA